jgi:zinc transporter 1/2/3
VFQSGRNDAWSGTMCSTLKCGGYLNGFSPSTKMIWLLMSAALAHGNHGSGPKILTPEERAEQCDLPDPDLFHYSVGLRTVSLVIVFFVSLLATSIPLLYRRYFKKKNKNAKSNIVMSSLKLFGTGVLISTAFIHMLPPSVQIFENKCFPDVFRYYRNWPGTIFLLGFIFSHFIQQQASNYIRSKHGDQRDDFLDDKEKHDHVHHIALSDRENSILANALEFGLCSHSVVVGFALGTLERDFTPLFFAILVHQFFEGLGLSSVVAETTMTRLTATVMVVFYCLSTPFGIMLGIIFRMYNTGNVTTQLAIGISEAFCGGVLTYDSIGNLMALHFFGEYYHQCSTFEKNVHIFALWGGIFVMGLLGVWA